MTEQDNVGVQRTEGDDARPALKPWLFLDCDGVVSPLPPRDPEERERLGVPAGYFTFSRAFWSVYFDEWIRDWVSQLGRVFDIVWSSSWEEEMLWKLVCQPLGFPRWPSVEAGSFTGRNRVDYKAKAVGAYLDQSPRPFAWVDDDVRPGRSNRAVAELGLQYILISPGRYVGLTLGHVGALLEFATRQGGTAAHRR